MRSIKPILTLATLSLLPLAGCQEGALVEPLLEEMSIEDQLTLGVLADPASAQTALDLAGIQSSAAQRRGWGHGAGNTQRSQAELRFQEAQNAFAQGNQVRALERAREGRQLVAQAIEAAGGTPAIAGMVERMEALPLAITSDPDAFVTSGKLGLQIGMIAEQAREAMQSRNHTRAGALGVLSEQAFRHNHRHQNQVGVGERAEVAVALAGEAVELATEILGEQDGGADTEQLDLLTTAEEFLAQAEAALEAGEKTRASHLAHMAQWWALKALILPGGITDEDARFILGLATGLLADAEAAVEADPTDLRTALLVKAARMLENGTANVGNGKCRGLGALWQSAVISSFLIG